MFTNFKARKALMLHSKGHYTEAQKLYEEAYAQGLNAPRYLLTYSVLLLRLGDYEKASEVLKKIDKARGTLTPDQRAQMLTNYAIVSWKMGRLDYALDLLREVYRKGANGAIYGTLGFLLIEKGDFEEALAFNQEALEYDDEDSVVLDNLAQTYYRLGNDKAEARKWFKKALAQKESAIDTNYFLALYDIEDGDMDAAREKLETAKAGRFSPLNYATPALIEEALGRLK
jgi:tetratricopeptide (TPR) repeat protein